jgi:hypothetical protein
MDSIGAAFRVKAGCPIFKISRIAIVLSASYFRLSHESFQVVAGSFQGFSGTAPPPIRRCFRLAVLGRYVWVKAIIFQNKIETKS